MIWLAENITRPVSKNSMQVMAPMLQIWRAGLGMAVMVEFGMRFRLAEVRSLGLLDECVKSIKLI